MGLRIAIVGEPTKGKSTGIFPNSDFGIVGLDPKKTVLLSFSGKQLPFKGANVIYPKGGKLSEGSNHVHVSDVKLLPAMIKYVSDNRPDIENIVLEDAQYSMGMEFMARAKEKGYDKFTDIGVNFTNWMIEAQNSRDNLKVFVIWHPEKDRDGAYKMKTVGNMLDNYLTPEGLMDIILYATCSKGSDSRMVYQYVTNNDGTYPARTPAGMFDDLYIPNDLGVVAKKINEYYN